MVKRIRLFESGGVHHHRTNPMLRGVSNAEGRIEISNMAPVTIYVQTGVHAGFATTPQRRKPTTTENLK